MSSCRPLYRKFQGQCQAQKAYLEINEIGKVFFDYSGEIGYAIPMDVYTNVRIRFTIPSDVTYKDIEILREEIEELAPNLTNESEFRYDSNSNYRRFLSEKGELIKSEIEDLIEDFVFDDSDEGCWDCGCDYCYSESNGHCLEKDCEDEYCIKSNEE